jgi:flagellar protein FlbD
MIKLTRLGGEAFILNADLIRYVEARPDTFVTLTTGERLVVTEAMDEVLRRAVAYQQAKHILPPPARPVAATPDAPRTTRTIIIERPSRAAPHPRRTSLFRGAARRAS